VPGEQNFPIEGLAVQRLQWLDKLEGEHLEGVVH
jgi:hypothetical protein